MTDPRIVADLRTIQKSLTSNGKLPPKDKLEQYYAAFRERFGPDVLRSMDGEKLLVEMHALSRNNRDTMAYWLEFKNDDEFPAVFGSISGGSALKWGVYSDAETGEWMVRGSGNKPVPIGLEQAIEIARRHREEIFRGVQLLEQLPANGTDADYKWLQSEMDNQCTTVSPVAWGHKYFSLLFPKKLDDYHVPNYQRFHLVRLLQPDIPPADTGRYLMAGRYVALAAELDMPINHLTTILNGRTDGPYRYWRLRVRLGDSWPSWTQMLSKGMAALAWDRIGDLADLEWSKEGRKQITDLMQENYQMAGGPAASLFHFVVRPEPRDLVVAELGSEVLGIGRFSGRYSYRSDGAGRHQRPIEWLSTERWPVPVTPLDKHDFRELEDISYMVEIERKVLDGRLEPPPIKPHSGKVGVTETPQPLSGMAAKLGAILERKGQVVLYGPPGTGKTHWALSVARDLVSHAIHERPFGGLSETEREGLSPVFKQVIKVVTFHPGYGYEDFIEGYRPESETGNMRFVLRDGIFKRLAQEADGNQKQKYFLIIDEINRGDIPRIFGELLTLLEKEKRSQYVTLPVSGDLFSVPPNLYVIGTMNTADRSIALLDTALRRRFGFIELMPDYQTLGTGVLDGIPLARWLQELNARILANVGRDGRNLQIGHAYLMSGGKVVADFDRFARLLQEDIIPLLEEYAYEDYGVLESILGRSFVDSTVKRIRHELFEPGRRDDLVRALLEPTPELSTTAQVVSAEETEAEIEADEAKDE